MTIQQSLRRSSPHTVRTVIIPTAGMRPSLQRQAIQDGVPLIQTEFPTLYEWVVHVTLAQRAETLTRVIEPLEQIQWVLHHLERWQKPGRNRTDDVFQLDTPQRTPTLAQTIIETLQQIRLYDIPFEQLEPNVQPYFRALLRDYEMWLQTVQAVDYPMMLQLVLEMDEVISDVYYIADRGCERDVIYSLRERQLLERFATPIPMPEPSLINHRVQAISSYGEKVGIDHFLHKMTRPDETVIAYTNRALLWSLYTALKRTNMPATFERGIPFEWTETYHFIEKIFDYVREGEAVATVQSLFETYCLSIERTPIYPSTYRLLASISGMTYGRRAPFLIEAHLQQLDRESKSVEQLELAKRWFEYLHQMIEAIEANPTEWTTPFIQFVEATYNRSSERRAIEWKAAQRILRHVNAYVQQEVAVHDSMQQVLQSLQSMTIHAEQEAAGHVHVTPVEEVGQLIRPSAAIFGLSTNLFPKEEKPSPFMSETLKARYGIPTILQRKEASIAHVQRIIDSAPHSVTLFANVLDTEHVRPLNPSLTWQKYAHDALTVTYDIPQFQPSRESEPLLEELSIKLEQPILLSPTRATILQNCQRQYVFRYVLKLKNEQPLIYNREQWLTSDLIGTLYHSLFETYTMRSRNGESVDIQLLVDEMITYAVTHYVPIPHMEHQIEEERRRMTDVLHQFVQHLEVQQGEGWEIIEEEWSPSNLQFERNGEMFQFTGIIDRIDYHADTNQYRIIDYKTGKKENAKSIQLALYEDVYRHYIREQKGQSVQINSAFHFPFLDEMNQLEEDDTMEQLWDAFETVGEQWMQEEYKPNDKKCLYCDYRSLCAIWQKDEEGSECE